MESDPDRSVKHQKPRMACRLSTNTKLDAATTQCLTI